MKRGFTLIELLIVMTILSVLVGLVGTGLRSSQIRGRDAQRKSDLKQIASALELFFSDYGKYPDDDGTGLLKACPFDSSGVNSTNCVWGESEFTDGKTIYLKQVPKDPGKGLKYFYRLVSGSSSQKYQVFAFLENTEDKNCLEGNCQNSPVTYNCGSGGIQACNFAATSSNTNYSE